MSNQFKVGDTVKRVKGGNEGEVFVVGVVGYSPLRSDYCRPAVWAQGKKAGSSGFHYEENLVLVETGPTLEEQQAKAKAELDRINTLIAERDTPKLGSIYVGDLTQSYCTALVMDVVDGTVFYRVHNPTRGMTRWAARQGSITWFAKYFTLQSEKPKS